MTWNMGHGPISILCFLYVEGKKFWHRAHSLCGKTTTPALFSVIYLTCPKPGPRPARLWMEREGIQSLMDCWALGPNYHVKSGLLEQCTCHLLGQP